MGLPRYPASRNSGVRLDSVCASQPISNCSPELDAGHATKTIAELAGLLSVVQVHPGDEDERYASMYVVTLNPDLTTSTAETLANLVDLVKECELNLPRKVRPPTPAQ